MLETQQGVVVKDFCDEDYERDEIRHARNLFGAKLSVFVHEDGLPLRLWKRHSTSISSARLVNAMPSTF